MIGVFDSGIGGLGVLREIRSILPEADLLYVADRAWAPYGVRSLAEVRVRSLEVARWMIERGAATVVVACNTASAAALDELRAEFGSIPIVGMEPAVKPAVAATNTGTVAVFATQATFQGRLFESLLNTHAAEINVIEQPCPAWVELVEAGRFDGPEVERALQPPIGEALSEDADVFVLGCTHFPFLRGPIERLAGPGVTLVDPAPAVAIQTQRVCADPGSAGSLQIAGSGDLEDLARLVSVAGISNVAVPLLPFRA